MRIILAILLVSLSARAAIAPADAWAHQYAAGLNSFSIPATGANLGAVCGGWTDSTITSATFGGNAMTLVSNHAITHGLGGSMFLYQIVGVVAGSNTVAFLSPGQTSVGCQTVSGAKQTAQPDAVAAYITGVTDGATEAGLPVTTVADASMVIGVYVANVGINNTPSSNGTLLGTGDFSSFYMWSSTANVSPAGSFTLQAKDGGAGNAYEAIGVSMAPVASAVIVANPSVSPIAVGP